MICVKCNQISKQIVLNVPDWFGVPFKYRYSICDSCGGWQIEHIDKPPSFSGSIQNFARRSASPFTRIFVNINLFLTERNFRYFQRQIHYKNQPGSLLDIGCGRGQFLLAAEKRGWKVFGIEPQPDKYEDAKRFVNGPIIDKTIEEIEFENIKFDVIHLWHVIEHIENIGLLLNKCKNILHDSGKILIAVPNIDSIQAKIFGIHWFHLSAPVHRHQFGEKSLEALMLNHGFRIIKFGYYDLVSNTSGWFVSFFNILGYPENYFWHKIQKTSKVQQKLLDWQTSLLVLIPFVIIASLFAGLIERVMRRGGCLIGVFLRTYNER